MYKSTSINSCCYLFKEIQRELQHIIKDVPGLEGIAITDRDGVPVIKSCSKDLSIEQVLKPSLLAATASSADQGAKLGIGRCLSVICEYDHYQVVSLNKSPFVVTLIANKNACTGLLLALQDSLDPVIQELTRVID